MFPIIPQYYYEDKTTVTKQKTVAAAKIFASSIIYPDCQTEDFQIDDLFDENNYSSTEDVNLSVEENGIIKCNMPTWFWITKMRLADDCHSSNVRLCRNSSSTKLRLECIKKMQPFEEPILWFSHDLLACLQIPFLIPANIQGEKQYVCHVCGYQYEMPNPLKIHIALNCKTTRSLSELWNRLRIPNQTDNVIASVTSSRNSSIFAFRLTADNKRQKSYDINVPRDNFKYLTYSTEIINNPNSDSTNNNNNNNDEVEDNHLINRLNHSSVLSTSSSTDEHIGRAVNGKNKSAFKPYVKQQNSNNRSNSEIGYHAKSIPSSDDSYGSISPTSNRSKLTTEENLLNKRAAEMEAIVSNLGKIKNGHLCIYCGKMYSRKYGLKIHIRTHTGFKPLKCKYCMRPFGDPSNLNKHVRLHSEADTPYKCDHCGKILVRKRDLDRHMKSRHQSEEFQEI